MSCPAVGDDAKLGVYEQYRPNDPQQKGCAQPVHIGKPRFFGKNTTSNVPLYVAMDFEQYNIARTGMMVASAAAIVLGITLAVVLIKKKRTPVF